ncbi:OLC1v1033878C1 [Oldenlandia corymbosa var. corymbosa]|uniref:OLC1v1033878C1 n=1 Tax=Oldenlandia corymbosa var. corymbosa TaxID=529605 RepID=A0AAV1CQN0_OLDCO|nr:OLC1v1033878C1 [Oldenlandia corymbosa var. corymbosa]
MPLFVHNQGFCHSWPLFHEGLGSLEDFDDGSPEVMGYLQMTEAPPGDPKSVNDSREQNTGILTELNSLFFMITKEFFLRIVVAQCAVQGFVQQVYPKP